MVNVIATTVVTANGSANGALTTGNGYVSGIFGASVVAAGMIRGGSVNASANLIVGSNTWVNGGILSVGNTSVNSTMNSINITVQTANFGNASVNYFPQSNLSFANVSIADIELTTSGTGQVVLDYFPLTQFRSAEYVITVKDNTANGYQVSKFLVIHDDGNPVFTEYGLLTTNSALATFTASTNSVAVLLQMTPLSVNTNVKAIRT